MGTLEYPYTLDSILSSVSLPLTVAGSFLIANLILNNDRKL